MRGRWVGMCVLFLVLTGRRDHLHAVSTFSSSSGQHS
jgi:hypothetical protein